MAERLQDKLRQKLAKKYGPDGILTAQDIQALGHVTHGISCQCLSIDLMIGRPGLPAGRLTEICGLEGHSKSTTCYHLIAECQRLGGIGVLVESEEAFESKRLTDIGVNANDLILCQPRPLEEAFDMI